MDACAWCGAPLVFRGAPAYELYGGHGGEPLVHVCYEACSPPAPRHAGTNWCGRTTRHKPHGQCNGFGWDARRRAARRG